MITGDPSQAYHENYDDNVSVCIDDSDFADLGDVEEVVLLCKFIVLLNIHYFVFSQSKVLRDKSMVQYLKLITNRRMPLLSG